MNQPKLPLLPDLTLPERLETVYSVLVPLSVEERRRVIKAVCILLDLVKADIPS